MINYNHKIAKPKLLPTITQLNSNQSDPFTAPASHLMTRMTGMVNKFTFTTPNYLTVQDCNHPAIQVTSLWCLIQWPNHQVILILLKQPPQSNTNPHPSLQKQGQLQNCHPSHLKNPCPTPCRCPQMSYLGNRDPCPLSPHPVSPHPLHHSLISDKVNEILWYSKEMVIFRKVNELLKKSINKNIF